MKKEIKINEEVLTGNVGVVHAECAPKPQKKFLTWMPQDFLGNYVKIGFTAEDGRVEHMWVQVTEVVSHKSLKGRLDNDPILTLGLKRHDEITFNTERIEDFLEG